MKACRRDGYFLCLPFLGCLACFAAFVWCLGLWWCLPGLDGPDANTPSFGDVPAVPETAPLVVVVDPAVVPVPASGDAADPPLVEPGVTVVDFSGSSSTGSCGASKTPPLANALPALFHALTPK